ncbi:MAG: F0F1 ATP synthase subunit delta [Neisseriaceae bacterium]
MAELVTVARPYARALYELADEENQLENWLRELSILADIASNAKIKLMLHSPRWSQKDKLESLVRVYGENNLSPALRHLLEILAQNYRLTLLPTIYNLYYQSWLARSRTEEANVYCAHQLSDAELRELLQVVERHCKVKLVGRVVVDPELIGGFKVEFGDQVLDMSVKSELKALHRVMIN